MPRQSKNTFTISGDMITISHPDWDFIATATIQDDYAEKFQSVTWSKKGEYLYNEKLGGYLHIYIMKKWYGEETYEQMSADGYVVDHMDNNGRNCCIDNLFFLLENENKAKGFTVDQYSEEKTHIALLFLDNIVYKSTFAHFTNAAPHWSNILLSSGSVIPFCLQTSFNSSLVSSEHLRASKITLAK